MPHARPYRALALLLALLSLAWAPSCRSPGAGAPPAGTRTPIEKPWTRDAIESHTYLWIELSTGKRGLMTGPVLGSDEKGEFLTTKKDPSVRLDVADILVLEVVELPPELDKNATASSAGSGGTSDASAGADGGTEEDQGGGGAPIVQSVGGSLLAFWGSLIFFVPTILLIVLLA